MTPADVETVLSKGLEAPAKPALEFLRPSEVIAYEPPPGQVLVGQNHIVRGSVFVIGGAPGVGKSRASVALAIAGATGREWFGYPVHRSFRTLIVQNENGRLRLKDEFSGLPCADLDAFVRVSPPPPYGFALEQPDFTERLTAACHEFAPDVVLFDPWNAAARDDKAGDYLATFKAIRGIIPGGDDGPAIGIVAHTRKPKSDERASGRGLLNLLAGSYVLGSVPRAVFVLQPASDAPEDGRVVFTCCKNNDGPLGEATAWERRNGLFVPVSGFDWDEFRNGTGGKGERVSVTEGDVAAVLANGTSHTARKHAIALLCERTGCKQSAAYNALSLDGRFGKHLEERDGFLRWIP
jgi:hypothetical protein